MKTIATIRHWKSDDRAQLITLHQELQKYERTLRDLRSHKDNLSELYFEYEVDEAFEDPDVVGSIFVAEVDGKIVGFIICFIEGDILDDPHEFVYIMDVMVTDSFRGQGIGKQLIESVRQFAKEHNITRLQLPVLANNKNAIEFYQKMGFQTSILTMESNTDN